MYKLLIYLCLVYHLFKNEKRLFMNFKQLIFSKNSKNITNFIDTSDININQLQVKFRFIYNINNKAKKILKN